MRGAVKPLIAFPGPGWRCAAAEVSLNRFLTSGIWNAASLQLLANSITRLPSLLT